MRVLKILSALVLLLTAAAFVYGFAGYLDARADAFRLSARADRLIAKGAFLPKGVLMLADEIGSAAAGKWDDLRGSSSPRRRGAGRTWLSVGVAVLVVVVSVVRAVASSGGAAPVVPEAVVPPSTTPVAVEGS